MAKVEQKYIVLALSIGDHKLQKVLNCDADEIQKYVRGMGFKDSIELVFFPIDKLNSYGTLTLSSMDVEHIEMNNTIALADFDRGVEVLLRRLEIKLGGKEDE